MSEKKENNLEKILKNLPSSPWIYQFFDKNEEIIYVWKSVNLKSRVNSYFNGKAKLNFAKQKMISKIKDIKIIIVNNETESLILETNLIKKHKPKYNILMKDDKNHTYIKITNEKFPKIIKTRIWPNSSKNNGTFFWPYLSSAYVENILKMMKKIFWYWVAENHFFVSKNSYNLDKYLFKWNEIKQNIEEEYAKKIESMKNFLKQDFKKIIPELEEKMKNFAKNLEFERAGEVKKDIESIKSLEINQLARENILWDYDVINFLEKYEKIFIWVIKIRESKIISMQNFEIENNLEENIFEILEFFIEKNLLSEYLENTEKIPTLIFPSIPNTFSQNEKGDILKNLEKFFKIEIPKIWPKKEILNLCYKNIYEFAYKKHIASLSTKGFTKQNMLNLLEILWYSQINKNIIFECNDISHFSGNHTVASRSVIENGKIAPNKYKKYRIKSLEQQKINDFDSMREVFTRRLKEISNTLEIPDLIIIDGWKGQLWSVCEILENFKNSENENKNILEKIQIVSIAKREEELFVFRDGKFEKFILEKTSSELRMVQKIRDEAHRFAITFNRDSRIKSMKKNILESLPWFWVVTRKKILKKYGNVENLANFSVEELSKDLNKNQIKTLEEHGII